MYPSAYRLRELQRVEPQGAFLVVFYTFAMGIRDTIELGFAVLGFRFVLGMENLDIDAEPRSGATDHRRSAATSRAT